MRNYKLVLTVLAFIYFTSNGFAQKCYYWNGFYEPCKWEIGTTAGMTFANTDVGTAKNIFGTIATPDFLGGIYVQYNFLDQFGVRLESYTGHIRGDDKNGMHSRRNLNYTTSISELNLVGEWYISSLYKNLDQPVFAPYVSAGIGLLHFRPATYLNGSKIYLQPLSTEGQGFLNLANAPSPYSLDKISLTFSAGVKYDISYRINLRAELMFRKTNTDYLDDVSSSFIDPKLFDTNLPVGLAALAKQLYDRSNPRDPSYSGVNSIRGDPTDKDVYWCLALKIGFKLY